MSLKFSPEKTILLNKTLIFKGKKGEVINQWPANSKVTEEQFNLIKKFGKSDALTFLSKDGEFINYTGSETSKEYFKEALDSGIGKMYDLGKNRKNEIIASTKIDIQTLVNKSKTLHLSFSGYDLEKLTSNLLKKLATSREDLGIIIGMDALKTQSENTATHAINVGLKAIEIGKLLGLDEKLLVELGIGGFAHDTGKILTPNEILNKKGRFTDKERNIMNLHSHLGYHALIADSTYNEIAALMAGQHHELEDGSGYGISTGGVEGYDLSQIPEEHRKKHVLTGILTIADMIVAISEPRVYHKARNLAERIIIMNENAKGGKINKDIYRKLYEQYTNNLEYFYTRGDIIELPKSFYQKNPSLESRKKELIGLIFSVDGKTTGKLKVISNTSKDVVKIDGKEIIDFDFTEELIL